MGYFGFRDEQSDADNQHNQFITHGLAACQQWGLFSPKEMNIIAEAIELLMKKKSDNINVEFRRIPMPKGGTRFTWIIKIGKDINGEVFND